MNTIKTFNFNNVSVSFNEAGYLNATQIASHFGKRVPDFLKTEQKQEYISALAEHLSKTNKLNNILKPCIKISKREIAQWIKIN